MKKILSFAAVLLMLAGVVSCRKEDEKEIISLKDTKWKLAGFVDTQTGNMVEVEPKCDDCYILSFDTDSIARGYSFLNIIDLHLKPLLKMWVLTSIYEHNIGTFDMFYNTIYFIESYTLEDDALKIFYNNSKNYLLYKPFKKKEEDTSLNLKGTKWKLANFIDVQTGNITWPTPQCGPCYYLAFDTDSTAFGHSLANVIHLSLKPVLRMGTMTEVYDAHNGTVDMFYEAMESLYSYTIENNTLKIFYNNNNNYLLYKPHEP